MLLCKCAGAVQDMWPSAALARSCTPCLPCLPRLSQGVRGGRHHVRCVSPPPGLLCLCLPKTLCRCCSLYHREQRPCARRALTSRAVCLPGGAECMLQSAAHVSYYGFYVPAPAGHLKWVCACMYMRTHTLCLPLTTPPSTSAAAPPPPPHTIVGIDACRTQCGGRAVCCEGRLVERAGGGRPTGININYKHARRGGPRSTAFPAPPPALAAVTRTPTQTHQAPQITLPGRGNGRSAAPGGRGHCLGAPFAKPRPPAGRAGTALSSQHCPMLQWRALT